jgi:O-antigen/teichoic acid export membrane protein
MVVLGAGTMAAAVLALLYQLVIGRRLGPMEYADFAAALSLIYFGAITAGPVNATAARFGAEYATLGDWGRVRGLAYTLMRYTSGVGLLICVGAVAFASPLADWLHFRSRAPLFATIIVLYLTLLVGVARGILRGARDFRKFNINTMVEAGLRVAIGIPLVLVFVTAGVALAGYAIALVIALLLSVRQTATLWQASPRVRIAPRSLMRFGVPMLGFGVVSAGFLTLDMLMVKRLFDGETAGMYAGAVTLARTIFLIQSPFSTLLIPAFVAETVSAGRPAMTLFRVAGAFIAVALVPVAIFAAWPHAVLEVALGSAFVDATPLLLPLAAAGVLSGISTLLANALASVHRFAFLVPYAAGLAVEGTLIAIWHGSVETVATLVLAVQGCTAAVMLVTALATLSRPSPPGWRTEAA